MSQETPTIVLEIVHKGTPRRPKFQVTAKSNETVICMDAFDITSAEKRRKFIHRLSTYCSQNEMEFDALNLENQFNAAAYEATQQEPRVDREPLDSEAILRDLGVTILGLTEEQSIICLLRSKGKQFHIHNISKWAYEEMLLAGGAGMHEKLWQDKSAPPMGKYTVAQVREAVALEGAKATLVKHNELRGQGIWKINDDYIVVDGGDAWVYKEEGIIDLEIPKYGDVILDVNDANQWNAEVKNCLMQLLNDRESEAASFPNEAYLAVLNEVQKWNWAHPKDAEVIAALVFCTFTQTAWRWRPLVSVTGPSDCGKSTLMSELLLPIFGPWTVNTDRSTEAGLRQAIGLNAAPILIDEFDQYDHRERVLQLFRTSGRGGRVLRGTQDQSGTSTELRHLPWFFSIESGDFWTQDRNRFLRLELKRPEQRGQFNLPSYKNLRKLGDLVAATAIWAMPRATELAGAICGTNFEKIHGRVVESFSVPAAMAAVLNFGNLATEDQARIYLNDFLSNRASQEEELEPDEHLLLKDIFSAVLRVSVESANGGNIHSDRTVAQILAENNRDNGIAMEAHGIRLIVPRSQTSRILFIADDIVSQRLLHQTRWAKTRIDQILLRLPSAERTQQTCGGQRPRGIAISWPTCCELLGLDEGHFGAVIPAFHV